MDCRQNRFLCFELELLVTRWTRSMFLATVFVSFWTSLTISQEYVTETADAKVTLVVDGCKFTEGPAVDSQGNVFFTDQPNDRIMKIETNGKVSEFLKPAGRSNGMFFTEDGKLIACADEKNEMWEILPDKTRRSERPMD